jgi:hypothetical protein
VDLELVFPFERFAELQVEVVADGVTIPIGRAATVWDFYSATDPVFWVDDTDRMLLFRNLEVKDATSSRPTASTPSRPRVPAWCRMRTSTGRARRTSRGTGSPPRYDHHRDGPAGER